MEATWGENVLDRLTIWAGMKLQVTGFREFRNKGYGKVFGGFDWINRKENWCESGEWWSGRIGFGWDFLVCYSPRSQYHMGFIIELYTSILFSSVILERQSGKSKSCLESQFAFCTFIEVGPLEVSLLSSVIPIYRTWVFAEIIEILSLTGDIRRGKVIWLNFRESSQILYLERQGFV